MVITVLLVAVEWGFCGYNGGVGGADDASHRGGGGDDDGTCDGDEDDDVTCDDGGRDDWAAANDQHCRLIQQLFSIHRLNV